MIQAFKLINKIEFKKKISYNYGLSSFIFKPNKEEIEKVDLNTKNKPILINKAINNPKNIEQLYKIYIISKHIRIIKLKNIILIIKKFQKIYINL